jgi:phosphoribosylformylglycinamidine cyclo-ligase
MYNTYNMGVGMCVIVPKEDVDTALEVLRANGDDAYVLGNIVKSEEKVVLY